MLQNQSIIPDIKAIIDTSRENAIRVVDNERTVIAFSLEVSIIAFISGIMDWF